MANEQNLISWNQRTESEQREYARQGGQKSGEVRRQRKAMKEQMEMLLSLPVKNKELKKKIKNLGIKKDDIDNQMALIISLYQTALKGGKNSVQAFNTIAELTKEKQKGTSQTLADAIQEAYENKVGDE